MRELLEDLNIKQHFTSVEHPQTNGQEKAANRVLLRGSKRRLDDAKGSWPEELPHVLWAYCTTPHSTTRETPFRLTYGTEAVILVEARELSWRTTHPLPKEGNDERLSEGLYFIDETRSFAAMTEAALKHITTNRYNKRVRPREFHKGDLVI